MEEERHILPPSHTPQDLGKDMDIDHDNSGTVLEDEEQPSYPSLIVTAEDIIKATRGAKRLTSGGL